MTLGIRQAMRGRAFLAISGFCGVWYLAHLTSCKSRSKPPFWCPPPAVRLRAAAYRLGGPRHRTRCDLVEPAPPVLSVGRSHRWLYPGYGCHLVPRTHPSLVYWRGVGMATLAL